MNFILIILLLILININYKSPLNNSVSNFHLMESIKNTTLLPFILNQTHLQLPQNSSHSFSVLSYNILADVYTNKLLPKVPSQYLDFIQRSKMIVNLSVNSFSLKTQIAELEKFDVEIICLQEVDHYADFYKSELERLGYNTVYKQKNNKEDGSLIGFKNDLFELVKKTELNFDQGHKYEKNLDFQKGTIGLVASLKHKTSGKIINIITTHLFWDPKYEHVKYLQMSEVLKFVSENLTEKDIMIWTGDLNSDTKSNLVSYVLENTPPELEKMQYQTPENFDMMKEIFDNLQKSKSSIKLSSAYHAYGEFLGSKDTVYPNYSVYTSGYMEVIDHIFYSQDNLQLTKLLKIPSPDEIDGKDLPNSVYPSDHLPLIAQFYLKPDIV